MHARLTVQILYDFFQYFVLYRYDNFFIIMHAYKNEDIVKGLFQPNIPYIVNLLQQTVQSFEHYCENWFHNRNYTLL